MGTKRLSDHAKLQTETSRARLEDIADKPVTILEVVFQEGDFGTYAVMTVAAEGGEKLLVQTGAMYVMDALLNLQESGDFPCEATFHLSGRTWLVQ